MEPAVPRMEELSVEIGHEALAVRLQGGAEIRMSNLLPSSTLF